MKVNLSDKKTEVKQEEKKLTRTEKAVRRAMKFTPAFV